MDSIQLFHFQGPGSLSHCNYLWALEWNRAMINVIGNTCAFYFLLQVKMSAVKKAFIDFKPLQNRCVNIVLIYFFYFCHLLLSFFKTALKTFLKTQNPFIIVVIPLLKLCLYCCHVFIFVLCHCFYCFCFYIVRYLVKLIKHINYIITIYFDCL